MDWTVASDARDKTDVKDLDVGLEFINQLQPKTYRWDQRSLYGDESDTHPDGTYKKDQLDVGFLAQDVSSLEEQLGFGKSDKKNCCPMSN